MSKSGGCVVVGAAIIGVLIFLGLIGRIIDPKQAKVSSTPSPRVQSNSHYRHGHKAGRDSAIFWTQSAGHPKAEVMRLIARREWEQSGRHYSFNPQAWQDGWIAGFDEGFAKTKTGETPAIKDQASYDAGYKIGYDVVEPNGTVRVFSPTQLTALVTLHWYDRDSFNAGFIAGRNAAAKKAGLSK